MTVDELIDSTWEALRPSLFRRAVLGQQRCAELVMHVLAEFPDREFASRGAVEGNAVDRQIRSELEARVSRRFHASGQKPGRYGSVFFSIVVTWAVSAIVQYLVVQWWKRQFDAAAIRRGYGWK